MINTKEFINLVEKTIQVQNNNKSDNIGNIVMVWYCKTIQNHKGIFYDFDSRGFYEASYNGDKKEIYLDRYIIDKKAIIDTKEYEA